MEMIAIKHLVVFEESDVGKYDEFDKNDDTNEGFDQDLLQHGPHMAMLNL